MNMEKCPICGYGIGDVPGCQCLFGGSAHPDRHLNRRVVLDHLYLLTPAQLEHVIELERQWRISYGDEAMSQILRKLEEDARSK